MDYTSDPREGMVRGKITPIYLWIPAIVSFLFFMVILIIKLSEKVKNSFAHWGWVVADVFICLALTFGVSYAVYMWLSMKNKGVQERSFNTREKCDDLVRKEIRRRTGYKLSDFSETGDSIEGVGWYGQGGSKDDQDKIYYHLYRIQTGNIKRYLLGVMNTEVGKEDDIIYTQTPMNFRELPRVILETCNRLCRNPVRVVTREKVFTDEVSGRQRTEKEESPLDMPENGQEVDYSGGVRSR